MVPSTFRRMISHAKRMRFSWLPCLLTDLVSIVLAYYGTVLFRFRSHVGRRFYDWMTNVIFEHPAGETDAVLETFYYVSAFRIILILSVFLIVLYALRNLYAGKRFLLHFAVTWNVLVCNLIVLGTMYFYWYLTRNVFHPRSLFGTLILLNVILCPVLRGLMQRMFGVLRRKWGIDRCPALLVGDGKSAEWLHELLTAVEPHGVYCCARLSGLGSGPFKLWLDQLRSAIHRDRAGMLIVADASLSVPQIMQVIELTAEEGIPLKILSDHLEVLITEANLPCDILSGTPLVHFDIARNGGCTGKIRRGMTIVCTAFLLLLVGPLMFLIAGLIRLTSPGAAIFKQKRIGVNRQPFDIYKFRTMRHMAEDELASIESENESNGALFKIRRDPRITPVGRFLRRFSLDELPQLLNIVKGEMAIVGPRPLPERDFEKYEEDWHYIRHGGVPGLTCLWQISGRSNLDFHQMCILDIYYLRNHNWVMDLQIVLQTVRTVLFGVGAY